MRQLIIADVVDAGGVADVVDAGGAQSRVMAS
jgi:hypothetical protein